MNNQKNEKLLSAIQNMDNMINTLLDEETGCPWDKEQTPHTLSEYTIEECFEVVDAIRKNEVDNVCDEMGDLVFGIMLIAKKYAEQGSFDFADALNKGIAKMRRRHPHVFDKTQDACKKTAKDMEELHTTWESIKKEEKAQSTQANGGVLSSIPQNLPSLTKAYRIHAKAANVGFTWDDEEEVERQVEAEWLELLRSEERRVGKECRL